MINLTKHQFKICEAVALGLSHYYMGPNDRRKITEFDRLEAGLLIPMQPKGWMQNGDKMPWSCMNKRKSDPAGKGRK